MTTPGPGGIMDAYLGAEIELEDCGDFYSSSSGGGGGGVGDLLAFGSDIQYLVGGPSGGLENYDLFGLEDHPHPPNNPCPSSASSSSQNNNQDSWSEFLMPNNNNKNNEITGNGDYFINHQHQARGKSSPKVTKMFVNGWEELKKKVTSMNDRTGSKSLLEAVFDDVIYKMEEEDKDKDNPLLGNGNGSSENGSNNGLTGNSETLSTPSTTGRDSPLVGGGGSVVERDHRYAAVILTQRMSSPNVRDHQYNQPSTSNSSLPITPKASGNLMKRRHKRDGFLVKSMELIFLKKKKIEEVTHAKITLEVYYDRYIFTEDNYHTANDILTKNRRKVTPVPVIPNFDPAKSSPQIMVRVDRANANAKSGVSVQFVRDKEMMLTLPPSQSQHDHSSSSCSRELSSPTPILATEDSLQLHTSILDEHERENENQLILDLNGDHNETFELLQEIEFPMIQENERQPESFSLPSNFEITGIQDTNTLPSSTTTSTSSVGTNTEPICVICYESYAAGAPRQFWIRCTNPLCHYLVHPSCIGLRVMNSEQLEMMPAYYCPQHR